MNKVIYFRKKIIFYKVISGMALFFLGLSFKYYIFIPTFLALEIFSILEKPKVSKDIKEVFDNFKKADAIAFGLLMLALMIFLVIFEVLKLSEILKVSLTDIQMIIAILLGCINIPQILIFMYYEKKRSCEKCKCASEDE